MAQFIGTGTTIGNARSWAKSIVSCVYKLNRQSAALLAVLISAPLFAFGFAGAGPDQDKHNSNVIVEENSSSTNESVSEIQTNLNSSASSNVSSSQTTTSTSVREEQVHGEATVVVNGTKITAPHNGSVHKVIKHENGNGQTVVDIQRHSSSTGNTSYSHSYSTSISTTSNTDGGSTTIIQQ